MLATPTLPTPVNEAVLSYAPGTPERTELKQALRDLAARPIEIPLVIGGKEKIKRMALQDPDMEPLWPEIGQL